MDDNRSVFEMITDFNDDATQKQVVNALKAISNDGGKKTWLTKKRNRNVCDRRGITFLGANVA